MQFLPARPDVVQQISSRQANQTAGQALNHTRRLPGKCAVDNGLHPAMEMVAAGIMMAAFLALAILA